MIGHLHTTHRKHRLEMLILLGKDPWTFASILGITIASAYQWVAQYVNPVISGLTLLLAMVLALLGIIEKAMIIRQKWEDRQQDRKVKRSE